MLTLAIDNVIILFLDCQGPSGQKIFHLLCEQPLQGCMIHQQGEFATHEVMPKLFHAIDRSQALPLDDTVVSLCRCEGLTSINNDVPVLLQNSTDSNSHTPFYSKEILPMS